MNTNYTTFIDSHIYHIQGNNFTGKSETLKMLTGLRESKTEIPLVPPNTNYNIYIGPEIYSFFSGLATTVRHELALHNKDFENTILWKELQSISNLHHELDNSPFALSGGQQALLTILCSYISNPNIVALDSTLEQLDRSIRAVLLGIFANNQQINTVIADNRPLPSTRGKSDFQSLVPIDECRYPTDKSYDAFSLQPDYLTKLKTTNSAAITLESITFSYPGSSFSLHPVSLSLQEGYNYLFLGENGSGKSTLSKILAGILEPLNGNIQVNGKYCSLVKQPGEVFAYHFQNPDQQLFGSTVVEEVSSSVSRKGDPDRIDIILETFGLSNLKEKHPLDCPFTMRKRIALAAVIAMDTPWVILDEPTIGQDDSTVTHIIKIIQLLNNAGRGVILITHDERLLDSLEYSVIEFSNGKITS